MRDFRQRTFIRSILYSPLIAGILLILIFFVGHATIKMFKTYFDTRQNYEAALGEFAELKNREENIQNRINTLRTERGVEGEIRNKFGLIKEGEEVVIIVEPPVSFEGERNDNEKSGVFSAKNFFELILNIFK